VDILCGYLRVPHGTDHGDPGAGPGERELRLSIIRVIRDHLMIDSADPLSWRGRDLDFTGATFDGGDFAGVTFAAALDVFEAGRVSFRGAIFRSGYVSFHGTEFAGGEVTFEEARFELAGVSFVAATFSGARVSFRRAIFDTGRVLFDARRSPAVHSPSTLRASMAPRSPLTG